ncbi:MAG: ATP-binding protein [Gammaproteobacteria bacterium]|nr:ATP-binding protein [Gammaproteobacteria bacterium]
MKSIRIFLVVMLLAIMILTVFLAALHGYKSSMAEVQQLFDFELADKAHLLAITGNSRSAKGEAVSVSDQYAFQVWQDSEIIQRSDNTPLTAITNLEGGYHDINFNNYRWRTYTWFDPAHNRSAITAERIDVRNALVDGIILKPVLPIVAALPVAGLLIWLTVGYGLAPLRNLANHLRSRRAEDLRPIPATRQPLELMQVITSTNDLFSRLEASFARERQFASDAAHELRTPISALKVHLHNISKDLPAGHHDLVQLEAAADRMGNLVEQILALHRTAPDQYMTRFRELDLYQLVQAVIISTYSGFEERNLQLELTGELALMSGDQFALEALVKNLLDNACKYTPVGGHVCVSVSADSAGTRLQIEDSGTGVPEEQYHRIFDRFYRVGGDQHQSGVVGCGLGLAIVKHIADLHSASIDLQSSSFESGLSIAILFPHGFLPESIVSRNKGA